MIKLNHFSLYSGKIPVLFPCISLYRYYALTNYKHLDDPMKFHPVTMATCQFSPVLASLWQHTATSHDTTLNKTAMYYWKTGAFIWEIKLLSTKDVNDEKATSQYLGS